MKIKLKFLKKIKFNQAISNYLVFIFIILSFTFVVKAQAATFFMTPQNIEVKTGDTFTVDLRVNSAEDGFNAAEATIQYPKNLISIKSIDYSPAVSVFNFWLDGPRYSNADGSLTFIGGTVNGVVGASIEILKITFVANSVGEANMSIGGANITASDGSGTNILTTASASNISVKAGTTPTPPGTVPTPPGTTTTPGTTPTPPGTTPTPPGNIPTPGVPSKVEKLPEPTQITREPVPAKEIPKVAGVDLSVPFYPDQNKWYNLTSNFLAQWKISPDISGISTVLNKNTIFTPADKSEGLFESKFFPTLEDGIWYLHLMLKNSKGWGSVSSYRLSIDTVPPLAFVVSALEGEVTDNPTPTLQFEAKDALSGLDHYLVKINQGEPINIEASSLKLPVQTPGKKDILVKAVDKAGNIRESRFTLEILPIPGPQINFINKDVFVDQGDLLISGTALPDNTVLMVLKNIDTSVLARTETMVNKDGNWDAKFAGPFKQGKYYIEVTTRDARGATSLPVKSSTIKIDQKPFLIIGFLRITLAWFFAIIVLLLLLVISIFYWYFKRWRAQIVRRDLLAQRDVLNLFNSVLKDLSSMIKNYTENNIDEHKASEMKFLLENSKKKLEKAEAYILENIKEIAE